MLNCLLFFFFCVSRSLRFCRTAGKRFKTPIAVVFGEDEGCVIELIKARYLLRASNKEFL